MQRCQEQVIQWCKVWFRVAEDCGGSKTIALHGGEEFTQDGADWQGILFRGSLFEADKFKNPRSFSKAFKLATIVSCISESCR